MNWRRWAACSLVAGLTMFLVGAAFHLIVPAAAPGIPPQYLDPGLFRPRSGWTSTYMALHPFGFGVVFASAFLVLRRRTSFIPGPRGGLLFGAGLFVAGSLPVFLLSFASFRVSGEVVASWAIQNLAQYTLAGVTVGCVADGMTVRVSSLLPAPAERVWELLPRKDTFLFITRGMMGYDGADRWPDRLLTPGATIAMRVRIFGRGPAAPHEVRVVRFDEAGGEIATEEAGGLVESWVHEMRVEPVSGTTCRYTDRIALRAGLLTPLVWLFAALLYRHRHRRWRKLLEGTTTVGSR